MELTIVDGDESQWILTPMPLVAVLWQQEGKHGGAGKSGPFLRQWSL